MRRVIVKVGGFLQICDGVYRLSFWRSSTSNYFNNVNPTAPASMVIKLRLVELAVVIETKLAAARSVPTTGEFLYAKHDQPDPRRDSPNMSAVRILGKR